MHRFTHEELITILFKLGYQIELNIIEPEVKEA